MLQITEVEKLIKIAFPVRVASPCRTHVRVRINFLWKAHCSLCRSVCSRFSPDGAGLKRYIIYCTSRPAHAARQRTDARSHPWLSVAFVCRSRRLCATGGTYTILNIWDVRGEWAIHRGTLFFISSRIKYSWLLLAWLFFFRHQRAIQIYARHVEKYSLFALVCCIYYVPGCFILIRTHIQ